MTHTIENIGEEHTDINQNSEFNLSDKMCSHEDEQLNRHMRENMGNVQCNAIHNVV